MNERPVSGACWGQLNGRNWGAQLTLPAGVALDDRVRPNCGSTQAAFDAPVETMQDGGMPEPLFAKLLIACDDASSFTAVGGNRFIKKLPGGGSLNYLHKLHTPLSSARINKLHNALRRSFPTQFIDFLRWTNGASLFDNRVHLYGLIEEKSRDIAPENQQPISIIDENRIFHAISRDRWNDGWTLIGSVVGWDTKLDIELHEGGMCAITSQNDIHSMASFEQCLTTVVERVGACYSCDGLRDNSYAELESALASFHRPY